MLAIRLQRTGRKGHAQFRMIVQESRRTPSSGNIVAALGSYDPHTKVASIDAEKAATYLNNGAQPSPRVAVLLQKEGVKMPSWVKIIDNHSRAIKNVEKLRRNAPAAEVVEEAEPAEAVAAEEASTEIVEAPEAELAVAEDVSPEADAPAAEEPTEEEAAPAEEVVEAKTEEASEAQSSTSGEADGAAETTEA